VRNGPAGTGLDLRSLIAKSIRLHRAVAAEIARSRELVRRAHELSLARYPFIRSIAGGSGQGVRDISAVIAAKIAAGTLPTIRPEQVWVGKSQGEVCDACDQPIAADDLAYEVTITSQGVFRFHRKCFDAWHEERAELVPETNRRPASLAAALWKFLEGRRGQMFCTQCLVRALGATRRLDRAVIAAEGRGAHRRHRPCSVCGRDRLVCGLASL
jgi:hypothetical protein